MERLPYLATRAAGPYDELRPVPVCVVLDGVRSAYNAGAFFRTADATAIDRLVLTGITARPPHAGLRKTALGAEETVRWEHREEALTVLEELRGRGYEIAAVETGLHSVDLFDWRPSFPVAVVFGHEVDGIGPEVLERCDTLVRIPMLGVKHSLNVATAGGVVLYELLRKYRRLAEEGRRFRRPGA